MDLGLGSRQAFLHPKYQIKMYSGLDNRALFGNSLHITPIICICGFSIYLLHILLIVFLVMPVPINNVGTSSCAPKNSFATFDIMYFVRN